MKYYSLICVDDSQGNKDTFYIERQLSRGRVDIGWGFHDPRDIHDFESMLNMIRSNPDYVTRFPTKHNSNNGARSLLLFIGLKKGDIIFVRGNAKIVDVVKVKNTVGFDIFPEDFEDYHTYVNVQPLGRNVQLIMPVCDIPREHNLYHSLVFGEGRSRVMKQIENTQGDQLLRMILEYNHIA